jgi:hypothetical protein
MGEEYIFLISAESVYNGYKIKRKERNVQSMKKKNTNWINKENEDNGEMWEDVVVRQR